MVWSWLPGVMLAERLTRPEPDQPVVEDERDRAIIARVARYQYVGLFVAVAAWVLVVSFIHNDEEQIPLSALVHLMPAMLLGNAVFASAGAPIAHWRAR